MSFRENLSRRRELKARHRDAQEKLRDVASGITQALLLGNRPQREFIGKTSSSSYMRPKPLTTEDAEIARSVGLSEQEVEKLDRVLGELWLRSAGIEYPEDWE